MIQKLISPSKINLFFRVLKKRDDGFHEIASLFQAIDLCDFIEIQFADHDLITCTDPTLLCDSTNLIHKAREAFRSRFTLPPVHIHLIKKIPIQSGLGGGSGNAATTLWGLNQLMGSPASDSDLSSLGAQFGSDISFFFSKGLAYCTGRGEKVQMEEPLEPFSGWIAKPSFGLSTPSVYKNTRIDSLSSQDPLALLSSHRSKAPLYLNDLEISSFQLEPRLIEIKGALLHSFQSVLMTGSGTAFFCLGGIPKSIDGITFFPFRSLSRNLTQWYCAE